MSVYSDIQIKQAIDSGHIVAHPFVEDNVNGSSLDVTLGHWYYKTEQPTGRGVYNPFSPDDVERYFKGPYHGVEHHLWCQQTGRKLFEGIPYDHQIIVIEPGERILAHTHEFVGIRAPGTSTMQARSTWGRNGVAVCLDAGWGDPGYINRWTMEIYNMNMHESVILPVGERIAQLVFHETGEVGQEYASNSGKYQETSEQDLPQIIKAWQPQQMLPRAYKDKRIKPGKI